MGFLKIALQGDIKKFAANLKKRAKEENRSYIGLWCSFFWNFLLYQCAFSDFLDFKYYEMTHKQKKEFVSTRVSNKFYTTVNPDKYKTYFTVKPNFLRNFARYCPRDWFCPDATLPRDEEIERLSRFLADNPEFMQKPVDGLGGHNVRKISRETVGAPNEYYDKLTAERLFVEELIIQHEDMSRLNASSVNTIRVMTFAAGDKSRIFYAFVRVGDGSSEVDNFHAGGMSAVVDFDTGELVGDAVNKQNVWFERHPLSGIKFDGYKLPNWDMAREMVLNAALQNQKIHCVGWDVAITPEGCTLVEGNRRAGFDAVQSLSKRGRKDLMREILSELSAVDGKKYRL